MNEAPMSTMAFCSRCGTGWVANSRSCAACGYKPDDGSVRGAPLPAGRGQTLRNPLVILNIATLVIVLVIGAFVIFSLRAMDERVATVEAAAAAMDTSSLQTQLDQIQNDVSNTSTTVDNQSAPDYSGDLSSIETDLSSVSDMVSGISDTLSSISDKADAIYSALPGC